MYHYIEALPKFGGFLVTSLKIVLGKGNGKFKLTVLHPQCMNYSAKTIVQCFSVLTYLRGRVHILYT